MWSVVRLQHHRAPVCAPTVEISVRAGSFGCPVRAGIPPRLREDTPGRNREDAKDFSHCGAIAHGSMFHH